MFLLGKVVIVDVYILPKERAFGSFLILHNYKDVTSLIEKVINKCLQDCCDAIQEKVTTELFDCQVHKVFEKYRSGGGIFPYFNENGSMADLKKDLEGTILRFQPSFQNVVEGLFMESFSALNKTVLERTRDWIQRKGLHLPADPSFRYHRRTQSLNELIFSLTRLMKTGLMGRLTHWFTGESWALPGWLYKMTLNRSRIQRFRDDFQKELGKILSSESQKNSDRLFAMLDEMIDEELSCLSELNVESSSSGF